MNSEKTILRLIEGPGSNYFKSLHQHFGGQISARSYHVDNASLSIFITSYILTEGMELLVTEGKHAKVIEVERIPDEDPNYIHVNIFKEGQFTQTLPDDKKHIEAGTTRGAFVYNGLFPLHAEFPSNATFRSISFKFNKLALEKVMPEALETYSILFGDNAPIAYHFHLAIEAERLIDDIFVYRKASFGNQTLVMAKGLETFTNLMLSAKQYTNTKDFRGLHVDDYERLLQIKDHLLANVDQKITVDGIANAYGVSPSKLKRDFKTLFNCSIYQFYTHARMDEAFRMLKSGKFSVMDVGYELGYQNLSKFSEMFKKVKGLSPKEVIGHSV